MRTNRRMQQLIERCDAKRGSLSGALKAILDEGLASTDGCVLLKSQLRLTEPDAKTRFQDETGYECFVNHVHLEDMLSSADTCVLLDQALAFADELGSLRSTTGVSEPLEYIISIDESDVNVRFHALRKGQSWLADDLETYEEAVAAIRLPKMNT